MRDFAIACSRGQRWRKCAGCHRPGSIQCEGRSARGRQCSAYLCGRCATAGAAAGRLDRNGRARHLCPRHLDADEQLELEDLVGGKHVPGGGP